MSMDGLYPEYCLEQYQGMSMDGRYPEYCLEQYQGMSMDGRVVFCSCKNDISAVRGGHILKMQDAYFEGMSTDGRGDGVHPAQSTLPPSLVVVS